MLSGFVTILSNLERSLSQSPYREFTTIGCRRTSDIIGTDSELQMRFE